MRESIWTAVRRQVIAALALGALIGPGPAAADEPAPQPAPADGLEAASRQVDAVERSFAQTMAKRDLAGFASMIATDAVFRSDGGLLVGRDAVVAGWKGLFGDGPAPFSWEPDAVTVSQSGDTALSSGPVFDRNGRRVARFTSIWRRERDADGQARWRIIVDQGVPIDACK